MTAWEKTAATTTPHSTQPHRHSDGPQGQTGLFVNQLPDGSQKEIVSHSLDAPQTRKSLVKGERFIRSVWKAEIVEPLHCQSKVLCGMAYW